MEMYQLDPLIKALIERLPPSDTKWAMHDRKIWLNAIEESFKLIYQDDWTPKF